MASEHAILCPLCGNKVPPGLTRCPVCATELQRVIAKHASESSRTASDFLQRDIPKVKLPQTKALCPQCGLGLSGGEGKCPRCGIPLSTEEATVECPDCGALSAKDSRSCPRCGYNLREGRAPSTPPVTPPRPAPPPVVPTPPPIAQPPKAQPPVRPEGKPERLATAEKVTPPPAPASGRDLGGPREAATTTSQSRSQVSGLVNGRGAINGTGLVNGTGITNGTRADFGPPVTPSKPKRVVTKWQFLALLVALIVVIPTFMYLTYPSDAGPITIDGKFGDWSSVTKFGMMQNSASSSTNVTEWGVVSDTTDLYIYVATRSETMAAPTIDSFLVFVDSDGSVGTGYLVSGIGADYKVEVDGWNGSIGSSSVTSYEMAGQERSDWNSWKDAGSASARLANDELEVLASVPELSASARYVLVSQTGQTSQGISYPIKEGAPILIVRQEPSSAIAMTGVIAKSSSANAMQITLSCQGGPGTVTGMLPSVSGATEEPLQTGTISLSPGETRALTVNLNTASSPTGSVISVEVSEPGVTTTFESITITGDPVRAYVAVAPSSIQIDGAFGDWIGRTAADIDSAELNDPNIDISAVGAVNTTASSSFYVGVKGEMCGGSFVPSQITKPSGSGGGTVIPTKKSGEDILRIYVDVDMSTSTGSVVSHPSKAIGADFLIEIKGLDGVIVSKSIMEFGGGSWNFVSGTVLAANDDQQLELSVTSASISGASSIDFIIEMTDWRGWSDLATSVPQGTRQVQGPDFGTRAWMVDGTITSAEATATSNQRKLFFDGINFWSVYVDGPDTVARYSADGVNWASDGRVFKTAGVVRSSIWYDAASQLVYVVGDRTAASTNVYLQRGSISPSTHTITWTAADRVLPVSSNSFATKNTFISKDASGYLWVMAVNCTGVTPTRYDLSVFRSSGPDSIIGTWTLTGNMLLNTPQSTVKGSVVPAGTGSNMWAVYVYAGTVASKKYTGSWSAESVLYIPSGLGSNTADAAPSALVDTRGLLHVVYGDDHEQPSGTSKPHIYYRYNTGSAWSAALALSSTIANDGFMYPTISLDASTGNLYAFWYDMQTQYVVAKRNVSGTWSSLTLNAQTANAKQHLTSIYSAPSQYYVCYQWTQNTTAPIHVIFDRIPEFSDAAVPMVGMIAVLVLVVGPMRSKRKLD